MFSIYYPIQRLKLQLLALIWILISIFGLSACNPNSSSSQASPVSQLVYSVLSDPKTFNYVLSQESPNIFGFTYEGLVAENPFTGKLEPRLAESWEFSEDKLKITFKLREGLRWSDGQPLTVDDVIFSYQDLYLNEAIPSNARDSLRVGQSRSLPKVRKVDQNHVQFEINEPFAPFLANTGLAILPKHALEESVRKKDKDGNPLFLTKWGVDTPPDQIIVNGPYKLERYLTSQRVIFSRNPYYWLKDEQGQQLPYIDQIIWQLVESTDTALLQFRSGDLDYIGVSPEYFSLLKKEEKKGNFTIYNGGLVYANTFLSLNLNQGQRDGKPLVDPVKSRWFNNVNFRRAIAYALDRQRMINNIYRGLGEAENSPISVQAPYYTDKITTYDFNPDRAKQLLKQEGFYYNDKNELLDAQGNRVRFSLITNAGNKIREAVGAQVKQDLANIGIQVDYTPISFNVLVDKLSNSLDWDAHIIGLTGGNEPNDGANIWFPKGNLHMFNQYPQPGGKPIQGWKAADWEIKLGELYVKGAQELDFTKRKAIYDETQRLTQEYLPFIYLVTPYSLAAVRNHVQGVRFSGYGGLFWNIERLKIEKQKRP